MAIARRIVDGIRNVILLLKIPGAAPGGADGAARSARASSGVEVGRANLARGIVGRGVALRVEDASRDADPWPRKDAT